MGVEMQTEPAARLAASLPVLIAELPGELIRQLNSSLPDVAIPGDPRQRGLFQAGYVHLVDELRSRSDVQPANYHRLVESAALAMHELFRMEDKLQTGLSEHSTQLLTHVWTGLKHVAEKVGPDRKAAYFEMLNDMTVRLQVVGILQSEVSKALQQSDWVRRIHPDVGQASVVQR